MNYTPAPGYLLRSLQDVNQATAPTNGQTLSWNATTSKFDFVDPGSIANGSVTNAKLADVATATLKGRATSGTGAPEDLSASQARTLLDLDNLYLAKTGGTLTGNLTLNPASGDANLSIKPTHGEDVAGALRIYGHIVGGSGAWPTSIEIWDTATNAIQNRMVLNNGTITMNNAVDATLFQVSAAGLVGIPLPAVACFNAWNMDQIPTGFVGDAVYRHPSNPLSGPCAKSASGTLQAGNLQWSAVRTPRNWTSYESVAFTLRYISDTTTAADAKITGISLYGTNDLNTWTTVYTDSTSRTPGTANSAVEVSINSINLATQTIFRFYTLVVGVQVRSNKCIFIPSAEVFGQ